MATLLPKLLAAALVAAGLLLLATGATGQVTNLPPGFVWQFFAQGFQNAKYVILDQPGGLYGGWMYAGDLTAGCVDQVLPTGAWTLFSPPGGQFPGVVGIAIDRSGLYNGMMHVAETNGTNLFQIAPTGAPMPIMGALSGTGGIAFDPGLPGYSGWLYLAQWRSGGTAPDCVMWVAPGGGFGYLTPSGSLADPRYLAFDTTAGQLYGGLLWVSEYATGNVLAVTPGGVIMPALANVGPGAEGITFGLGDMFFGSSMYTANLTTGKVDMIAPSGVVTPFAQIATGAAHIVFAAPPSPYAFNNLPTMYVADGNTNIYLIAPNPATAVPDPQHGVTRATWGQVKALFP